MSVIRTVSTEIFTHKIPQKFRVSSHPEETSQYLPDSVGPLLATRTCLYTNRADGHCIVDQSPEVSAVTLACGFSGHGFKNATVMAEVIADPASSGKTDLPIDFLRLNRLVS